MALLTYVTIADLTIGDKICFCTNCSYLKYGTSQCLVFTNLKDNSKVWSFDSFFKLTSNHRPAYSWFEKLSEGGGCRHFSAWVEPANTIRNKVV